MRQSQTILQTFQRQSYLPFPRRNLCRNWSRGSFLVTPKIDPAIHILLLTKRLPFVFLHYYLSCIIKKPMNQFLKQFNCSIRFSSQVMRDVDGAQQTILNLSGNRSWIFSTKWVRTFIQTFLMLIIIPSERLAFLNEAFVAVSNTINSGNQRLSLSETFIFVKRHGAFTLLKISGLTNMLIKFLNRSSGFSARNSSKGLLLWNIKINIDL